MKYNQTLVELTEPYPVDDYKWWAGPKGRELATRIKRYKRWIVILIGVSVIELIAVAVLVSIFAKIYVAFNKW